MSLDKAILHGKEKRKPYYKSGKFDPTCRPHGGCPYCRKNRLHKHKRRQPAPDGNGLVLHGPAEGYFGDISE
jgi:hypothetical protein